MTRVSTYPRRPQQSWGISPYSPGKCFANFQSPSLWRMTRERFVVCLPIHKGSKLISYYNHHFQRTQITAPFSWCSFFWGGRILVLKICPNNSCYEKKPPALYVTMDCPFESLWANDVNAGVFFASFFRLIFGCKVTGWILGYLTKNDHNKHHIFT